ncbi:hypothetical protein GCM10023310_03400 [Paenibacillus vulneris]
MRARYIHRFMAQPEFQDVQDDEAFISIKKRPFTQKSYFVKIFIRISIWLNQPCSGVS